MTKLVLVIDDNQHIQQIVQTALEYLTPWRVSVASSAKEGIVKANTEQPDAILMDYMMPEMNGADCLKQLRSDPATCTIPVLFLSASQNILEPQRLEALGAVGAIAKPFDPLFLAAYIRQTLQWEEGP